MPIYEYVCRKCGEEFEELVSAGAKQGPACPQCGSEKTEKLMSACSGQVSGGEAGPGAMPSMPPMGGGCGGPGGFS